MSCRGLAARVAISTSPTAAMRRPVAAATVFTRSRTSSSSPCISKGMASHTRSPNQALSHWACANSDSNDNAVEGRGGGSGLAVRLAAAAEAASFGGAGGSSGPSPPGPSRASRTSRPRGRPAPGVLEAMAAAALACAAAMTPRPDSWALTPPLSPAAAPSRDAARPAAPAGPPCAMAPSGTGPAVGSSKARQSGKPARCGAVGALPSRSPVRAS